MTPTTTVVIAPSVPVGTWAHGAFLHSRCAESARGWLLGMAVFETRATRQSATPAWAADRAGFCDQRHLNRCFKCVQPFALLPLAHRETPVCPDVESGNDLHEDLDDVACAVRLLAPLFAY